jgi:cytochrome c553
MAAEPRLPWLTLASALLAAPAPAQDLAACLECHGEDRPDPAVPSLGGQPELFLLYQLFYFREGQRRSEPMTGLMAGLPDAELQALAAALAALPPPDPATGADPALYAKGAEIAAERRCGTCHLPHYSGRAQVPRLAGQQEAYLGKALDDYRRGARVGTQAAMAEALAGLDAADLEALAHYLAHFRG